MLLAISSIFRSSSKTGSFLLTACPFHNILTAKYGHTFFFPLSSLSPETNLHSLYMYHLILTTVHCYGTLVHIVKSKSSLQSLSSPLSLSSSPSTPTHLLWKQVFYHNGSSLSCMYALSDNLLLTSKPCKSGFSCAIVLIELLLPKNQK